MRVLPFLFFISASLFVAAVQANSIDREWVIDGFIGEPWFLEPDSLVGQQQYFYKGSSEGALFECNAGGLSTTYTTYKINDFFKNPEFSVFAKHRKRIRLTGNVYVHRITCANNKRIFYPFITSDKKGVSYYLFENGIFLMTVKAFSSISVDGIWHIGKPIYTGIASGGAIDDAMKLWNSSIKVLGEVVLLADGTKCNLNKFVRERFVDDAQHGIFHNDLGMESSGSENGINYFDVIRSTITECDDKVNTFIIDIKSGRSFLGVWEVYVPINKMK